jgi:hypothetical protein
MCGEKHVDNKAIRCSIATLGRQEPSRTGGHGCAVGPDRGRQPQLPSKQVLTMYCVVTLNNVVTQTHALAVEKSLTPSSAVWAHCANPRIARTDTVDNEEKCEDGYSVWSLHSLLADLRIEYLQGTVRAHE